VFYVFKKSRSGALIGIVLMSSFIIVSVRELVRRSVTVRVESTLGAAVGTIFLGFAYLDAWLLTAHTAAGEVMFTVVCIYTDLVDITCCVGQYSVD